LLNEYGVNKRMRKQVLTAMAVLCLMMSFLSSCSSATDDNVNSLLTSTSEKQTTPYPSDNTEKTSPTIQLTEKLIYEFSADTNINKYIVSQNGKRIAVYVQKGDKYFIVLDGVEENQYDFIEAPAFSPDSKKFAYIACTGTQWLLVVDGKESKPCEGFIEKIYFSPDSKRLAYSVCDGEKWYVVIDKQAGKKYEEVQIAGFSPDNKHFVYSACLSGEWFVVNNGVAGKRYDEISLAGYLRDGKIVYIAILDNQYFAVVDGKESGPYDYIDDIMLSPDGKRYAYEAKKEDKYCAVVDGIEGKYYESLGWSMKFSPDSKKLAYSARTGNLWYAVVDGVESQQSFENLHLMFFYFSPDSKRTALDVWSGDFSWLVIDGVEGEKYDKVHNVVFSPDSQRIAYIGEIITPDKETIFTAVIDGIEGKQYTYIDIFNDSMVFSPDSKSIAYIASNGSSRIMVIDGIESDNFNSVLNFVFSPDSKRTAYIARINNSSLNQIVVLDGIKSEFYNVVNIKFSPHSEYFIALVSDRNKDKYLLVEGAPSSKYKWGWTSGICFDSSDNYHMFVEKTINSEQSITGLYLVKGNFRGIEFEK
jgi:hypothetical protein